MTEAPPSAPAAGSGTTTATTGLLVALARPVRRFAATEASSAGLLLVATVVALVWANSPWGESYTAFWETEFAVRVGAAELTLDLQHWVNDGLMVFFFFVVGLEVKRELVMGELTDRRRAAIPLAAAITGLAVPAAIFLLFNPSGEAAAAWGVVISTDTAFLLGVLVLVGPACPAPLRLFLLTLAVADDVGALTIIALFYTEDLALGPLALAALGLGLMLVMRYLRVWRGPGYLVVGVAIWVAMYASGVHPTIAGVVIALFAPAYPPRLEEVADAERATRAFRQSPNPEFARVARLSIERSVSGAERLQRLFQPWTSFVIVPIFALANAGVVLTAGTLSAALRSPLTLGVVAGLVVGKLLGILAGAYAVRALRLGRFAPGLRLGSLAGGAALTGIGFTISLFIVDLALDDPGLVDQARIGVLAASVLAALLGWTLFRVAARFSSGDDGGRPVVLDSPVDPERDHIRGPVDAPLTLVEYGDFECPFCGRATGVVAELRERFGDQLRYVFRHVPLVDVHPHAELAAEAAEAAAAQGRFWDFHDRLFAHQDQLSAPDLLDHAAELGLDPARFARDLGDGRYGDRVREDAASAEAGGAAGTPTFFLARGDEPARRHVGPYDTDTLTAALLGVADDAVEPARTDPAPVGAAQPRLGPARSGAAPPTGEARAVPPDLVETPDDDGAFPRLSAEQITTLARHGRRRAVPAGEVLFAAGDRGYDFHVVLDGSAAVVENAERADQRVVAVSGAGRFLGELNLLADQPVYLTAVVAEPGEVLVLTPAQLDAAFVADRSLRDVVVRAFLIRRSRLLRLADHSAADLQITGRGRDPATRAVLAWADDHGLAYRLDDLDAAGDEAVEVDEADVPLVAWRGRVLRRPGPADLDELRLVEP